MNTITIYDDGKTKTSELVAQCKKKFPVWSYWSDEKLDKNFPPPKEPTTREFENVQEAHDFAGKSTADLDRENVSKECCTLRERLLMELAYFDDTGENLDVDKATFCASSRLTDGRVPTVYFNRSYGRVCVNTDDPQYANGHVWFRRAVSLSPSLPSFPTDLESRVKALEEWKERLTQIFGK